MQGLNKSDSSLSKKLNKRSKQERLFQLQNKFDTSCKIERMGDYNALQDKHSYRYFTNRPARKHLKKLIKVFCQQSRNQVINQEPATLRNNKIIENINNILQGEQSSSSLLLKRNNNRTINQSQRYAEKRTLEQNMEKGKLRTQESVRRIKTIEYFDPYTHILKPTTLQKINKLRIEVLTRKRKQRGTSKLPYLHSSQDPLKEPKSTLQDREGMSTIQQINQQKVKGQKKIGHHQFIIYINRKKEQLKKQASRSNKKIQQDRAQQNPGYKK